MSWIKRFSDPVKLISQPSHCELEYSEDTRASYFNEWSLDAISSNGQLATLSSEIVAPRIDSYRFSMANLEDSHDVDLDAILGELCALESQYEREIAHVRVNNVFSDVQKHQSRTHSRSSSESQRLKMDGTEIMPRDSARTDSPDNDSAFSDTVSMLSSESSASSGGSGPKPQTFQLKHDLQDDAGRAKAEKIKLAMEKIKEAHIQKLFVKVFTADGSAKSLLIDEKMMCGYVTRLLADKNHVRMDPKWAIVERIPDLYMERIYEDHELLVENLMLWARDSKNKIYFIERSDKTLLFMQPEIFIPSSTYKKENLDNDEHSRNMLLENFFSADLKLIPEVEGPLYLKSDSKKVWKKYHFILTPTGLQYFQKEKARSSKDLVCLATFEVNQVYYGLGWKRKFKAPTDYCFAIKHPKLQEPKSTKYIKYLCAEDQSALDRWMIGIRIAKHGRQLMDNYQVLADELAQEDLDMLAHARSCSVSSIPVQSSVTTPSLEYAPSEGYGIHNETYSSSNELSLGRHSRASSSSSSGCMSDGAPSSVENVFDSEFSTGTIKRKPSMKPSLPLTSTTRQLKEVGETRDENNTSTAENPVSYTNSGTLTRKHSRRKSSNSVDDLSNNGTLKRQHSCKSRGSVESMGSCSGNSTPFCGTPVREKSSPFVDKEKNSLFKERTCSMKPLRRPANDMDMTSSAMDSINSLPPAPDSHEKSPLYQLLSQPHELYNSNLSLDNLPPPPNPDDLPPITGAELTGSQLSLMSLPPPPVERVEATTAKRKDSGFLASPFSPECRPITGRLPEEIPAHSRMDTLCLGTPTLTNDPICSTPTEMNSPSCVSSTHCSSIFAQQHFNIEKSSKPNCTTNNENLVQVPSYVPHTCKQTAVLPGTSLFNNGFRSSLRKSSSPRQISTNNISSNSSSISMYSKVPYLDLQLKNILQSPNVQREVNFHEPQSPKRPSKKISFNLTAQETPDLPKRPPPPKRSDSTKLTSPKKLIEPRTEFLKDLQRVMRKKWQVAQKCKDEPTTTPHEVLGFRDPPVLLPDYKETNVSNWVKEHYGPNNFYENVCRENPDAVVEYATSPVHIRNDAKIYDCVNKSKRPPPPPPKRSETTHLTTPKKH